MLTDAEVQSIRAEIEAAEDPRAACIEALKIVQRARGYVPDEAMQDLAPILRMTADELEGVATFYSFIFREPVGRHLILVCDSVTCWIMGYEKVLAALQQHLGVGFGGTTKDGRFTLLPVSCIGACDHAPAVMIDGRLYGDLDPEGIAGLLAGYE